ncbi:MAG: PqqD family protein [Planctomycetota bacterium]|nr:PqqD family protein [Planctomycetota bacterium]MDI6787896.1 PqqD family protein [Planctomycetota bacterium]
MSTTIQIDNTIKRIEYPFQEIENEIFIVDPKNRVLHQLNEVGAYIWEKLKQKGGGRKVSDIINSITDEYDIDKQTARYDVIQFLNTIMEKNLIKVIPDE